MISHHWQGVPNTQHSIAALTIVIKQRLYIYVHWILNDKLSNLFTLSILFNSDVCTWIPHLGTFLTVPSKWEDIVPSHKILRNLQQILDSPWGHWQVNLGPHWTLRRCSLSGGDQISLHPVVRWKFLIKHLGIDPLLVSCCISDFKQRKSSHFYKLP